MVSLNSNVSKRAKKQKPVLLSVKIHADVYRIVKTVAAWKGLNVADYLTAIAREPANLDFARILAREGKVHEEEEA